MPKGDSAQVQVRAAVIGDAETIASVHVDVWKVAYHSLLPQRFYDEAAYLDRRARWKSLLGTEGPQLINVASFNDVVIGFAAAGPARQENSPRAWQLFSLYLRPSYHGSGVADELMVATVGDRPAMLWVARDNPRARAFYSKHGFTPDGTEMADDDLLGLVELRLTR